MHELHPSELAHLMRRSSWNQELAIPAVAPNTSQEWEALQALDRARSAEVAEHAAKGSRKVVA